MKNFDLYLDTDYYKNFEKSNDFPDHIILFIKAKTDIIEVVNNILKLLDIKTASLLDSFNKVAIIGILEENEVLNLKMCYLISEFVNFYKFKVKYCNFITHVLPPILYNLRTFYERYSSFIELTQEERKQLIIEIKKRNEEDSYWLEEDD